ncbi:MAG: hypothetical protein ACP5HT_04310 [Conexivisphaera sp.]|jgi:predicted CopG family antitoxin
MADKMIKLLYDPAVICSGDGMPKRTTVLLDDDVYERLVEESVRRHGTARALSKVLNELLRDSIGGRAELMRLLYSDKIVEIVPEDLEEFRRELSRRFVER